MVKIRQLINGLQNMGSRLERDPNLDPMDTQNKKLESLRRLRLSQLEEVEEKQLRKDIKAFNDERSRRGFFGNSPVNGTMGFKLKREPKKGMFAGRGHL